MSADSNEPLCTRFAASTVTDASTARPVEVRPGIAYSPGPRIHETALDHVDRRMLRRAVVVRDRDRRGQRDRRAIRHRQVDLLDRHDLTRSDRTGERRTRTCAATRAACRPRRTAPGCPTPNRRTTRRRARGRTRRRQLVAQPEPSRSQSTRFASTRRGRTDRQPRGLPVEDADARVADRRDRGDHVAQLRRLALHAHGVVVGDRALADDVRVPVAVLEGVRPRASRRP